MSHSKADEWCDQIDRDKELVRLRAELEDERQAMAVLRSANKQNLAELLITKDVSSKLVAENERLKADLRQTAGYELGRRAVEITEIALHAYQSENQRLRAALADPDNHWHTPNADGPEPGCTACAALADSKLETKKNETT